MSNKRQTENAETDIDLEELSKQLNPSKLSETSRQSRLLMWRVVTRLEAITKRAIDIVGSIVGLILLSPLLILVAIIIKCTDRGPALFWQVRIGKWGKPFLFPKFRSMVINAEALRRDLIQKNEHGSDGITFKLERDPRITKIGRFIRKTSIDELPQLWCVLKGDMSLVGPRPAIPQEVEKYTLTDRRRLDIKPGLTCIWQISGRSKIAFPEQCQLDVEYLEQQSTLKDVKILLKTIPAIITGHGAY